MPMFCFCFRDFERFFFFLVCFCFEDTLAMIITVSIRCHINTCPRVDSFLSLIRDAFPVLVFLQRVEKRNYV